MSKLAENRVEESALEQASGDYPLKRSESGIEMKSLLKMIDKVIETDPATDDVTPNSEKKTISETLMVPVKKYPKYNFVGRILGPRGMTVKQLEKETGCKIFVRGRASSNTFNPHTKTPNTSSFTNRNTLSTISRCALTEEPLHVYIECYDFPKEAQEKMAHAVAIINDLLSPPIDGKDELKRQQLVDISLINGTYRATSSSNEVVRQYHRNPYRQTVDPTSNPADYIQNNCFDGGDLGSVYGIAQQKRIWQKPRGPDASSEEYAKSVSSREYVSDIVHKTKKSPVKNSASDSLFTLPQSVVSETLKAAKNLLASHQQMNLSKVEPKKVELGAGDATKCPDFSLPPPPTFYPPPPPPPFPEYPMFCMMPPPPCPPYFPRRY